MINLLSAKNIHPFPARMAPEIAIKAIKNVIPGGLILDPMAGSGTVLHHAAIAGYQTLGFDLDPLAILMSTVRTNRINLKKFDLLAKRILDRVNSLKMADINLPWIDDDKETSDFINFWFAKKQSNSLRKIAYAFSEINRKSNEIDALKIAFSRIIITKKVGASLAWDISHSRPHKSKATNDYDVNDGFFKSITFVRKQLMGNELISSIKNAMIHGDARALHVEDNSVDGVITSPPYLNAIDYMRGHKFSLVWLGYKISELRGIRSSSVGVERKIDLSQMTPKIDEIYKEILEQSTLSVSQEGMVKRYIGDALLIMKEIKRVLKRQRLATLVIGNSVLNGQNVENSEIFKLAGEQVGLTTRQEITRPIPLSKRYLPVPSGQEDALGKRMRHEIVLTMWKSE